MKYLNFGQGLSQLSVLSCLPSTFSEYTIPSVHSHDLSFYQNATSRSQRNFSEVREKSGEMKVEKCGHTLSVFVVPIAITFSRSDTSNNLAKYFKFDTNET